MRLCYAYLSVKSRWHG